MKTSPLPRTSSIASKSSGYACKPRSSVIPILRWFPASEQHATQAVVHMGNEAEVRNDVPAPDHAAESPSCLALHGLGGGPYEIGPLIDALEADGLRVDAPILPGHEPKSPVMPASNLRATGRRLPKRPSTRWRPPDDRSS